MTLITLITPGVIITLIIIIIIIIIISLVVLAALGNQGRGRRNFNNIIMRQVSCIIGPSDRLIINLTLYPPKSAPKITFLLRFGGNENFLKICYIKEKV